MLEDTPVLPPYALALTLTTYVILIVELYVELYLVTVSCYVLFICITVIF